MKPTDIYLGLPPLVGTFGRSELEHAAAVLVMAMQLRDVWEPITWEDVEKAIEKDPTFAKNPFFKPSFFDLIAGGYAVMVDDSMSFTKAGLERLENYMKRRTQKYG